MKTRQETFDQAVGGVLAQGALAIDAKHNCRYRTYENGKCLKCAAGQLIPDDEYSEAMEGAIVCSTEFVSETDALKVSSEMLQTCLLNHGYDLPFVSSLQWDHDSSAADFARSKSLSTYKTRAKETAAANQLEWKFG